MGTVPRRGRKRLLRIYLPPGRGFGPPEYKALAKLVATPTADRLFYLADAMRFGFTEVELFDLT